MATASGRARILVADDDDLVRLVVRRVLERAGHEVVDVATVPAAIAAVDATIDLAVVDGHMPGGDLAQTLAGIRADRTVPVLIISGDAVAPAEAAAAGTAFLSKPVGLDDLTAVVGMLLESTR